jgi:hypothetical protein
MPDDETNDPLLAALRRLPREVTPPRDLEAKTVQSLHRARLLHRRSPLTPWLLAASLVVAAFSGGLFTGRRSSPMAPSPTYALLLYGGSTEGDSAAHVSRAAEYGAWAGARHADGVVIGGEALGDGGTLIATPDSTLTGAADAVDVPVGFFLVRAASVDAATRLARECPHLKYGGRIVVRAILPT